MWRVSRIALVVALVVPLLPAPATAQSSDPIKVPVDIGLIPGCNADQTNCTSPEELDFLSRKWTEDIKNVWNGHKSCGRDVIFEPNIEVLGDSDWKGFVVGVVPARGRDMISGVRHGDFDLDLDGVGRFRWSLPPGTVAHEFGHFLGLPDEYTWTDANGNGKRDPGEPTTPDTANFPDAAGSIMATSGGKVLPRHIRQALRNAFPDAKSCRDLTFNYRMDWHEAWFEQLSEGSIDFDSMFTVVIQGDLEEGEPGSLTGTATASVSWTALTINVTPIGVCTVQNRAVAEVPLGPFEVDGTWVGDEVSISLPDPLPGLPAHETTYEGACVNPVPGSTQLTGPWLRTLQGTLVDGVLFSDTTEPTATGGTYRNVIEITTSQPEEAVG